jgi:hypothetical protein
MAGTDFRKRERRRAWSSVSAEETDREIGREGRRNGAVKQGGGHDQCDRENEATTVGGGARASLINASLVFASDRYTQIITGRREYLVPATHK